MKKLLLVGFVFCFALCGYSEPLSGDDILAFVRTKLPSDPLKLSGTLKVRTKKGFTKASLPAEMELDWGAALPAATYRIGEQKLDIVWNNEVPSYTFSKKGTRPTDDIAGTGLNWVDLSFSMLWWPDAKLIKEEKKINRDCYVVDVPVPESDNTMRLWIEKRMGMLLEAQTLDGRKKEIRRMKIKSIKKMDGMWVAKDLEIRDKASGNKTTLQTTDLEWKNPKPAPVAFDPADSINQVSIDLYQKLSAEAGGNQFLSPYSISTALAMTYGGARGATAGQMNSTLHFGGQGATHPAFSHLRNKLNGIQEKGHVQLSVANKLWPQVDYKFLPDYISMMKEFYGTDVQPLDYKTDADGARQKINTWVEEQTNERIRNLIPENLLNELTRLVLVNAIYFKGNWATQFDPERTRPAPFKVTGDKSVEVPMMSSDAEFKLAHGEGFQALELPYEGSDLSMLVLLPREADGLAELEKTLSLETVAGLKFHEMKVMVMLPKFKLESEFNLGDTLKAMGMPLAFSDAADFSGMDGTKELHIDAVVHKAFVEVNEEGTEAAAATAVGVYARSMPLQFAANHPFLFLIRENSTGTILFIGRVMDPSK